MPNLIIVGGGLAGSEAAWQAAQRGIEVSLYEMRPAKSTGAHISGCLAELVCSNSFGSNQPDRASGVLKSELRRLGSLLLHCAEATAIPAGGALAVDREAFSSLVTEKLSAHPKIKIIREEVTQLPNGPSIIASGPLTSPSLTDAIQRVTGHDHLFFYDAIAPIVSRDSIDLDIAFRASRYQFDTPEEGDYLNCPLNKEEYEVFVTELIGAKRIALRNFEIDINKGITAGLHTFFEGCLPIEILARRDLKALAFGPMRPVGLKDPRTGKGTYAIVQLRQDNLAGSRYNLVGFQTNLTYPEQKRVFRLIPGLENAEFERYGQMHRNTFIASPLLLNPTLQLRARPEIFFAGQISGVEGYTGNIATGLLAGTNAANLLTSKPLLELPTTTMLGALCRYIANADLADFQPTKASFGLLPELTYMTVGKRERARLYAARSEESLTSYLKQHDFELSS